MNLKMRSNVDKSYVKRNPLLIPTIFEYDKEHISSVEVWKRIKGRLGNDVWKYFRKTTPKSDHMGIKKVQQTLKELSSNEMIKYMNVVYAPFEERNHFVWFEIDLSLTNLKKLFSNLALISPMIFIYQSKENKYRFLLTTLITNYLVDEVISLIMDYGKLKNLFFIDYKNSSYVWNYEWMKFDYSKNFDPSTKDWLIPTKIVEQRISFEQIKKKVKSFSCCSLER